MVIASKNPIVLNNLRNATRPATRRWLTGLLLAHGLLLTGASFAESAEPATRDLSNSVRRWTDVQGRTAEATLISVNGTVVRLRRPNGKLAETHLSQLSAADRAFAEKFQADFKTTKPTDESNAKEIATAKPSVPQLPKLLERIPGVGGVIETFNRGNAESTPQEDSTATGLAKAKTRKLPVSPLALAPQSIAPLLNQKPGTTPANLVHVRISKEFLEQFIARKIVQDRPVRDSILGTALTGTAHTKGATTLTLIPHDTLAVAEVNFSGTIASHTLGYNGPVVLHSAANTAFNARKQIVFAPNGLNVTPARSAARTASQTRNIESTLPGLRGRIAEQIAWRRVGELRGQGDAIAARHAEALINQSLDAQVNFAIENVKKTLLAEIPRFPYESDVLPPQARLRSTADYVELVMHRAEATPEELAITPPAFTDDDVSVRLHRLVIRRALTDPDLRQAALPLLSNLLANRAINRPAKIVDGVVKVQEMLTGAQTTDMATQPAVDFRWSDDRDWLIINYSDNRGAADKVVPVTDGKMVPVAATQRHKPAKIPVKPSVIVAGAN